MIRRCFFLVMMILFFCSAQGKDEKIKEEEKLPSQYFIHATTATYIFNNNSAQANPFVTVTQDNDNDQKNEQSQLALSTMKAVADLTAKVDALAANLQVVQPEVKEPQVPVENSLNSFLNWITDHQIVVAGGVVVTLYSSIFYEIYKVDQVLNDPLAWSNWHNNKKLEDFFTLPAAQLEADLLYAFQHRYIDVTNPMDFMYSLSQSALALDKEIELVHQQLARYQWIERSRCSRLFFVSADAIASLQEKQRKLAFLKHIFSSWCAHHKIEKNS